MTQPLPYAIFLFVIISGSYSWPPPALQALGGQEPCFLCLCIPRGIMPNKCFLGGVQRRRGLPTFGRTAVLCCTIRETEGTALGESKVLGFFWYAAGTKAL